MDDNVITFYRVLPGGLKPRRAMADAGGTLPVSAYRHCEPVRNASSFGYYVFLPMSFQLEWDGGQAGVWSYDDGANWHALREAAYPDSMTAWDAVVPDVARGWCPPFITFTETYGMVQIWTGWMVRTAPGWSTLVRGTANLPRAAGYDVFEGIIETDRWFGPLFMNIRLSRTEAPVLFDRQRPVLQVQPLHRAHYHNDLLNRIVVRDDPKEVPEELWQAYASTFVDHVIHNPKRGHYSVEVRRRRAEEDRPQIPSNSAEISEP